MENNKLYHYTSLTGFHEIIRSHSLRITRSDFMNDSNEGSFFLKLVENYIREEQTGEVEILIDKKKVKEIPEELKELISRFDLLWYLKQIDENINYYIFSLTTECDNLPMWNYYGNNGIQLELEKEELLSWLKHSDTLKNKKIIYGPVTYVNEEKSVRNMDNLEINIFDKDKNESINDYIESLNKRDENHYIKRKRSDNDIIEVFIKAAKKDLQYSILDLYNSECFQSQMSDKEIFKKIYDKIMENYDLMRFKKEILCNLLALSTLIKVNSYKHESEFRIVFINNTLACEKDQNDMEFQFLSSYNGIDYFKPAMLISNINFGSFLKKIVLSPVMKNLPFDQNYYKKVISDFLSSYSLKGIDIEFSYHNIRW